MKRRLLSICTTFFCLFEHAQKNSASQHPKKTRSMNSGVLQRCQSTDHGTNVPLYSNLVFPGNAEEWSLKKKKTSLSAECTTFSPYTAHPVSVPGNKEYRNIRCVPSQFTVISFFPSPTFSFFFCGSKEGDTAAYFYSRPISLCWTVSQKQDGSPCNFLLKRSCWNTAKAFSDCM